VSFSPSPGLAAYDVSRFALGLGVEGIDQFRGLRIGAFLEVALDVKAGVALPPAPLEALRRPRPLGAPLPDGLLRFGRHPSAVFALPAAQLPASPLRLRVGEPNRRYVPRRLELTYGSQPLMARVVLSPGAAYDVPARTTLVRGTVTYAAGGARVRWPRVEVRLDSPVGPPTPLGSVHGDDRGEFVYLVPAHALFSGPLADTLSLTVVVRARPANPPPDAATASDALWDLPVEPAVAPAPAPGARPVPFDLPGTAVPAGWTLSQTFTNQKVAVSRSTSLELAV